MTIKRLQPPDLGPHIGKVIGVSSWIVIDQKRINEFAHCTDDHQWIHVDVARATNEGPFGGTIAHGFLTLALLAPTIFEVVLSRVEVKQAINYGLERVRFLSPIRAGKRVRNCVRITSLDEKGTGRTLLTAENTIEIEGEDKPALIALAQVMLLV
jgi:acyl dehydratase